MSADRPLKLKCDEVQAAVALVREARELFGKRQAAALWRLLPLPSPDSFASRAAHASEATAGVLAFLNDSGRVARERGAEIPAAQIYSAYVAWSGSKGLHPVTWVAFGRTLTTLGIGRRKVGGGRVVYVGLQLAG